MKSKSIIAALVVAVSMSMTAFVQADGCDDDDGEGDCQPIVVQPSDSGDVTNSYNTSVGASAVGGDSFSEANSDSFSDSRSDSAANSSAISGDSSASSGDANVNVSVTGDTTNNPVNTAAQSIGSICVDSAAGQGTGLGISLSRANPVCEQLQMYAIYVLNGNDEKAAEALANAERLTDIRGFFRGLLTIITLGLL